MLNFHDFRWKCTKDNVTTVIVYLLSLANAKSVGT